MNETLYEEIKQMVKNQLDFSQELTDDEIIEIIDKNILLKSREKYISYQDKTYIANQLFNSLRRLDILQPLIEDPEITEIMVNGIDNIFVEKKGEIKQVDLKFSSREKLEDIIQNVVSSVNRVVNEGTPICDARLLDGSRVNVVMPPIALNGPILTIRKFSQSYITMDHLIELDAITNEAANFLEKAVRAKYNIFICGGTGSGKTTLLNILSNFIPKDERIITIEDSAELQIKNISNLVSLETRNSNLKTTEQISIRDLIKSALRMRPDRIIVGEVRGAETIDMLQAMNTGHDGSISTGHANSTKDMISRLETMVLTGANIPIEAIRQQIASSIDLIIHLGRMRDKSRKILEIVEVLGIKNGYVEFNPLFEFKEDPNSKNTKVEGKLYRTEYSMINTQKFIHAGIKDWGL